MIEAGFIFMPLGNATGMPASFVIISTWGVGGYENKAQTDGNDTAGLPLPRRKAAEFFGDSKKFDKGVKTLGPQFFEAPDIAMGLLSNTIG